MSDERLNKPSASSVARYMNCAGAFQLSQGVEEFKTKEMLEWAQSGDRIHSYLAGEISAADLLPNELEVAELCKEVTTATCTKHQIGWERETVEIRLWLKQGRKKLLSGKPDLIVIGGLVGAVFDYKSNRGDQDAADENYQILTNIVLAAEEHPEVEVWYGAIIQPLITREPSVVKYTRPDVAAARQSLLDMLDRIQKPDAPTNFGSWCKYCPAVLKCDSARAMLQTFGLIDENAEGQTLAQYLNLAKSAEPIIKRLKDRAKTLLKQSPDSVPGWQIGKGSSTRAITDPFACFEIVTAAGLMDKETFMKDCVSVGVGDLEKAVGKFKVLKPKEAKDLVNAHCVPVMGFNQKEGSLEQV